MGDDVLGYHHYLEEDAALFAVSSQLRRFSIAIEGKEMVHEEALDVINSLVSQLQQFMQTAVEMSKDGKISMVEGVRLSVQVMSIASTGVGALQGKNDAFKEALLFVLKNGKFILPG